MELKTIGLSTSAFGCAMGSIGKNTERENSQPWTLEQFVDFTLAHGLGGIETPLARFIPELNSERLKKLKVKMVGEDVFFLMDVQEALDANKIVAMIPFAKEFNSPIIRIKSSGILGCARKKLGRPWSEHVQQCISVLRGIAPQLRDQGLRVAIENHQDLDSNDLRQIIEGVGPDVVGVNFDVGNAFSVCEDPLTFIDKLGPAIINIHLKDYKIFKSEEGFRLVRCPLGAGAVDFKTILPLLAKSSPNAKMAIELGALEARNIAWLTPSFWEEIQPRHNQELISFFQQLEDKTIRLADDSWKTPWEQGKQTADVVDYEIAELKVSLNYLSTL